MYDSLFFLQFLKERLGYVVFVMWEECLYWSFNKSCHCCSSTTHRTDKYKSESPCASLCSAAYKCKASCTRYGSSNFSMYNFHKCKLKCFLKTFYSYFCALFFSVFHSSRRQRILLRRKKIQLPTDWNSPWKYSSYFSACSKNVEQIALKAK